MYTRSTSCVLLALLLGGSLQAQDPPTNRELKTELDRLRRELDALKSDHAPGMNGDGPAMNGSSGGGQGNLFNPTITLYGDFVGSISTRGENNALNRFSLREVELDARAAIAPDVDGRVTIAIAEEIESMANGDVEVSTAFELEEAFVDFHTLPFDLAAKAGKFRNAFGRHNLLHTHDIPQVTRPLASQAFFGHEGLSTTGVSVSWIAPSAFDEYIELTGEVINADGGEEAPILGGPNAENPAAVAHLKIFRDLGEAMSFELGGSYLYTRTADANTFWGHVFGVDLTWQWTCPEEPDRHSALVQAEMFYADTDIRSEDDGDFDDESLGGYAFGQYQPMRDWYFGIRGDYTEFPDSESRGRFDKDWAFSPYVSWYPYEFLRLRFEYQHRNFEIQGVSDNEENFFLNVTFVFGAHPPHPYWVNR